MRSLGFGEPAIVQDCDVTPTTRNFVDHCLELLTPLGQSRARRMFGGHGLYVDDVFIAIIAAERLYLKVDAASLPQFEAEGCEPFIYDAKGHTLSLRYFSAPQGAMDSPALMQGWARLALEAALRARAAKPAAAQRRTRAPPSARKA
jgi:DNA transformation protein and related proteins